jgi:hypothetical protein
MTREYLIKIFKSEPEGKNKDIYLISFEYRKKSFEEYKAILNELIKESSVKILKKTTKNMLCRYFEINQK